VACKSANQSQNTDAVRQGVNDYLTSKGLNMKGMDVNLSSLKVNGNQADVTASFSVKGTAQVAMTMGYHLEKQGDKWVVMGSQGGQEHGKTAPPDASGAAPGGMENPHAGGMPAAAPGGGGKMPSPEDLPPAGKKK
jgi:hypothetical protein